MKTGSKVAAFPDKPDEALVSLNTASELLDRSRVSLYRDARDGKLTLVKVGRSTRIRVGDLRRLIGAA